MTNPNNNSGLSLDSEKKTSGRIEIAFRGLKRNVKSYTISETEKKAYSAWNSIQNNSYNAAWSFFTLGIGLLIEAVFAGWNDINARAQAMAAFGAPVSFVLALFYFFQGKRLSKSAKELDEIIEKETEHDNT